MEASGLRASPFSVELVREDRKAEESTRGSSSKLLCFAVEKEKLLYTDDGNIYDIVLA